MCAFPGHAYGVSCRARAGRSGRRYGRRCALRTGGRFAPAALMAALGPPSAALEARRSAWPNRTTVRRLRSRDGGTVSRVTRPRRRARRLAGVGTGPFWSDMSGDRLTALDASFLHLEDASAHMHVASVMIFEGDPPPYDELLESIERRLHLVPRYRQKLAFVPLGQGRPRWVDDPHLNLALPRARHRPALARHRGPAARPGRPRVRPAAGPRQAAVGDLARRGTRGRALRACCPRPTTRWWTASPAWTSSACCSTPRPSPLRPPTRAAAGCRGPLPSGAQLLGEALVERATMPGRGRARSVRALFRAPAADRWRRCVRRRGRRGSDGLGGPEPRAHHAPTTSPIGPHRRFTWVRTEPRRT